MIRGSKPHEYMCTSLANSEGAGNIFVVPAHGAAQSCCPYKFQSNSSECANTCTTLNKGLQSLSVEWNKVLRLLGNATCTPDWLLQVLSMRHSLHGSKSNQLRWNWVGIKVLSCHCERWAWLGTRRKRLLHGKKNGLERETSRVVDKIQILHPVFSNGWLGPRNCSNST